MKPVWFPQQNTTLAKDQPQYIALPVYQEPPHAPDYEGNVISCWRLTWRERFKLLFSGRLWLSQLTFGHALQPQRPSIESPFEAAP